MELKKIRIQADSYMGYEVVIWRWWYPFWVQLGGTNTHPTIEMAKKYAERYNTKIYL